MKFTQLEVVVNTDTYSFAPYDRGVNGAFVYRETGLDLDQMRVVASAKTNDSGSDNYKVQLNVPRTCADPNVPCGPSVILGTDLVKTELRFLAATKPDDRKLAIDLQIALLQEYRDTIANREVIYS